MFTNGLSGQGLLVDVAALAAVSLVGFIFGRRTRSTTPTSVDPQIQDELTRAQHIGDDLRQLASGVAVELAAHERGVAAFQAQLATMQCGAADAQWAGLRESADKLVGSTLKLATNLTLATAALRRNQTLLAAFSASRIDRPTGLHNRRSLEEQLEAFFSIHALGKRRFSLAMFSVSPAGDDEPHRGEARLRQIARLLEECIRDDDFVARYSQDEFVVLMPQTAVAGALAFSERLLHRATADLDCPVWGGVVEATSDECPDKLLSRADAALYSARAAGGASLFVHTGAGVRRHAVDLHAPDAELHPADELVGVAD
jgi:diguanylate cyclase (GGDEF)-like protein